MNDISTRRVWLLAATLAAVLTVGWGLRSITGAVGPARASEPKPVAPATAGEDDAKATETVTSTYPVVLINPVKHRFSESVRGFGTVRPDARRARSVTNATQGVITEVLALPGGRVRRGQVLLRMEPDPLAYLAYQQAVSAEKLARSEVARLAAQRKDGLATASQVENAQKVLADAVAGVDAARRQGAASGGVALTAPTDGVVTALAAVVGDRPAVGTTLATIAPLADRVPLGIEPGLQSLVHVGDRVALRAVQGNFAPLTGQVAEVGAAVDPETHLVTVWIALEATKREPLLAGLAIEGTITTRSLEAFSLPRAALVKDEEGFSIFSVRDHKAHRVRVTVVSDQGPRVGVVGEIDERMPVVTTGAYELEDGVEVAEQKP